MKDPTREELQERVILVKKRLQDTKEEWDRKCKEANSKVDWSKVGSWMCGPSQEDKRKGYVYCRRTKKYVKEN